MYGNTRTPKLGIGTTGLSAELTVEGSIFPSNGIFDSGNSVGNAGQILSAGNGNQLSWINPPEIPLTNEFIVVVEGPSSGTYIVPSGTFMISYTVIGGGGGGGYGQGNVPYGIGGGGGGGSYMFEGSDVVTGGTVITYTVGTGGISSSNGTNSTIKVGSSNVITVSGGQGSSFSNGAPGYYGGGGGSSQNMGTVPGIGGIGTVYNGKNGDVFGGGNGGGPNGGIAGVTRWGGGGGGTGGGQGALYGEAGNDAKYFGGGGGGSGGGAGGIGVIYSNGGKGGNGYISITLLKV